MKGAILRFLHVFLMNPLYFIYNYVVKIDKLPRQNDETPEINLTPYEFYAIIYVLKFVFKENNHGKNISFGRAFGEDA